MSLDEQALSLNWVYGLAGISHNLVNLSDGYSDRVAFVAAHTAVIYDKRLEKQTFLQGHCNSISCMVTTEDRSTLITADVGNESLLVLWNSRTGQPIQSISQPHGHGIVAMDVSYDDQWLATLAAPDSETGDQEIAVWLLSDLVSKNGSNTKPAVLTTIPSGDAQTTIRFSMNDVRELITNGKRRVYFWSHSFPSTHRFKYYSPPLRSKDFKQNIGDFSMSVFVPGTTQALTATSDGDIVVWDEQGITAQIGTRATDRRAVKLMRIHSSSVTFLGTVGDYIVSGGVDGFIRFYDPLLRIVAWFEDVEAGPILSLSFSCIPPSTRVQSADDNLVDAINRFVAPDFVISTTESKIISVPSASFEEFDPAKRKGSLVLEPLQAGVIDLVAHPLKAEFATFLSSGTAQRWDPVTHACLASRSFPKMIGSKLSYSRDGSLLAVGFEAGFIHLISTETMEDIHVARNTPATITRITFSSSGDYVAVADSSHHVLLYASLPYKHTTRWEYVGKCQTHFDKIVGLSFGESPSGITRLFSYGSDGRIGEYDLEGSSPTAGLKLQQYHDFPASSNPTAIAFAPPVKYHAHQSADTQLITADAQFKMRLFNPDTKSNAATFLGPTFGGPVNHLIPFCSTAAAESFLAYSTSERVVGLLAWPMDGDPAKTMGLIAHPGSISAISVSYDGRKLMTAGADGTVNVWNIGSAALKGWSSTPSSPEERISIWERVIDNPETVQEIKEYFLFSQIKSQGENSSASRAINGKIPVSMLPEVCCAAGFYPSKGDIADMLNHVAYMAHASDRDVTGELALDEVLAIYANFRPLREVSQEDIARAFLDLGANPNNGRLARETLLGDILQRTGEVMTLAELQGIMKALTGATKLSKCMPNLIDANAFASDVLGFEAASSRTDVEMR